MVGETLGIVIVGPVGADAGIPGDDGSYEEDVRAG